MDLDTMILTCTCGPTHSWGEAENTIEILRLLTHRCLLFILFSYKQIKWLGFG